MELYIPVEKTNRDPTTGRFNKGCIPHNKGKKACEYMSRDGFKNSLIAGRKNLKPNRNLGGHNKRSVIAIYEGRVVGCFSSAEEASRKTGITSSAIRRVCYGQRNTAGGFKWQYD